MTMPLTSEGEAAWPASPYSVAKHLHELEGSGLPRQGTRIPRNTASELDRGFDPVE